MLNKKYIIVALLLLGLGGTALGLLVTYIQTSTHLQSGAAVLPAKPFPTFPESMRHERHQIGAVFGSPMARQILATGTVPYITPGAVVPKLSAYSPVINKTVIVYPGGSRRIRQENLQTFANQQQPFSVDPYIVAYDHANQTWEGPFKLAQVATSSDLHFYPTVEIDKQGYIHVFYTFHGGTRDIMHFSSQQPGSLTSWNSAEINATAENTYGAPAQTRDGKLYFFYRATESGPGVQNDCYVQIPTNCHWFEPVRYVVSENNGKTWSQSRPLITPPTPSQDPSGWNTIYLRAVYVDPYQDKIWLTFGQHRWHNGAVQKYFMVYLDPKTNQLHTPTGTLLGSEVIVAESDQYPDVVFAQYASAHDQRKLHIQGKDILLFSESSLVPRILRQEYNSSHPFGSDAYYADGRYVVQHRTFDSSLNQWASVDVTQQFSASRSVFLLDGYTYADGHVVAYSVSDDTSGVGKKRTRLARIDSEYPLTLSTLDIFPGNQQDQEGNGSMDVSFTREARSLTATMIIPQYEWWGGVKTTSELMSVVPGSSIWYGLPPIGSLFLLSSESFTERVDAAFSSESEAQRSCNMIENNSLLSCDGVVSRPTAGDAGELDYLKISQTSAQFMRFAKVASNVDCSSVGSNDTRWSNWEEVAFFKYLPSNQQDERICIQLKAVCPVRQQELVSLSCEAKETPDIANLLGDLNQDGVVNIYDYSIFLQNFGKTGNAVSGDLNQDGVIDDQDLQLFIGQFFPLAK